jgi:hypothetical protein
MLVYTCRQCGITARYLSDEEGYVTATCDNCKAEQGQPYDDRFQPHRERSEYQPQPEPEPDSAPQLVHEPVAQPGQWFDNWWNAKDPVSQNHIKAWLRWGTYGQVFWYALWLFLDQPEGTAPLAWYTIFFWYFLFGAPMAAATTAGSLWAASSQRRREQIEQRERNRRGGW